MSFLLLFSCTGLFATCVLLGVALVPKQGPSITKRIEGLQQNQDPNKSLRDQEVMNQSLLVRVILPLADKCSKLFSGVTPQGSLNRCVKDIAAAGMTGKVMPAQITTLSWMLAIGLPLFYWFLTELKPERTRLDYFLIFLALALGYRLPFGFVKARAIKRKSEIRRALPFTLDLISISVEAGMAFDGAMAIVAEKTRGALTDELNLTLREIRLGKSRNQALADLGERTDVDDLKSFLTAVAYISKLGGSLVDVIKIQAGAMRTKRRQRAEEKAMKTPVKIMFPLVLFIFPSMFVVILGPAALTMVGSLSHSSALSG